ncbi:MAG: hypothetical protein OEQ39_20875 [Gammaproteobacteria bacterium]|nr:hypothetical protein [Gammaproteobacteria bacterium]
MAIEEPLSQINQVEVYSEQPAATYEVEQNDLATFFMVGVIINIVMVVAYFVWAYKQWNNKTRKGKSDD